MRKEQIKRDCLNHGKFRLHEFDLDPVPLDISHTGQRLFTVKQTIYKAFFEVRFNKIHPLPIFPHTHQNHVHSMHLLLIFMFIHTPLSKVKNKKNNNRNKLICIYNIKKDCHFNMWMLNVLCEIYLYINRNCTYLFKTIWSQTTS